MLMELEKATGTRIDEGQFAQARTVADLVRSQPATQLKDGGFRIP